MLRLLQRYGKIGAVYSSTLTKNQYFTRIGKYDNMQPNVSAPDRSGTIADTDAAAAPFE
jgi:hypothetical protein